MDHNSSENRGQKMLSMIGIRLQNVGHDKRQWEVVTLDTTPNSTQVQSNVIENFATTVDMFEPGDDASPELIGNRSESNQNGHLELPVLSSDTPSDKSIEALLDRGIGNIDELAAGIIIHSEYEIEGNVPNDSASDPEEPFSSDDSVQDPDYSSDTSSTSSTSEDESKRSNEPEPVQTDAEPKRTRKGRANPLEWKKSCAKRLRNSGKMYKTLGRGVVVRERQLKPPCDEGKCTLKCSTKFAEDERLVIFKNYWAMADIVKQRTYILTLMQEVNPKYRYLRQADGRAVNHAFYFTKDSKKVRVCKYFFIATLGITSRSIRTIKSKIKDGTLGEDNRGKHDNHREVPRDIRESVRSHISSIPAVESHYTRAHSEKVYIEGSKTIAQLHRDYKADRERQEKPFANLTMYRNIFNNEFNLAFFTPKKDQCQACVSYENSNEEEKKELDVGYKSHIDEKKLSREEKEKHSISESYYVACFDLQAALPTPRGEVSNFYYKSKLSTYNFTVCDLAQNGQGPVNCYMWHEGEGKRGAIEIGTCLLHYLEEKARIANTEDLQIVLYSDNCCGQQKNKFVIAAYLYAVANYKIKSITHKFTH